jgi:hypothetical protein
VVNIVYAVVSLLCSFLHLCRAGVDHRCEVVMVLNHPVFVHFLEMISSQNCSLIVWNYYYLKVSAIQKKRILFLRYMDEFIKLTLLDELLIVINELGAVLY